MTDVPFVANVPMMILLFVTLSFGFRWLLVRKMNLERLKWKYIEYLIIVFAAVGIITLSADLRIKFAHARFLHYEQQAFTSHQFLISQLDNDNLGYICRKFTKTEYSPGNFETIQLEYDSACEWFKQAWKIVPKAVAPNFPPLGLERVKRPEFTGPILIDTFNRIDELSSAYNTYSVLRNSLKGKASKNFLESIIEYLYPLFLCVALALQFAKVSFSNKTNAVDAKSRTAH